MIRARAGDEFQVGDTLFCINEVSGGAVKLAIKAPKSVRITRR